MGADAAADLESVQARHVYVEHHEWRRTLLEGIPGSLAVVRSRGVVAEVREDRRHQRAGNDVVVSEQDTHDVARKFSSRDGSGAYMQHDASVGHALLLPCDAQATLPHCDEWMGRRAVVVGHGQEPILENVAHRLR